MAMIWFVIEAGVALLLAGFIVWFTTGGKRNRPSAAEPDATPTPPAPHDDTRDLG
jgi:hypothetical protein